MMKSGTVAALAWACLALPAAAETIRVGMSGGYFPFTFVRQDQLQGFEVDFMNAVAAETGDEVEFETMSFSGLIGALEAGRIDTVANQITITPEREAKFVFIAALRLRRRPGGGARGQRRTIKGVEDLRGKTVAVNLGSNFEELLRELPFADEIDIKTYESNIEQDTALGRVDAFVMDRVSTAQVIAESPLPLAARRPALLRDPERPAVPRRRGRPGAARPRRRRDHHAQGERHARRDLAEVARRRRDGPGPLSDGARPRLHAGPRPGHPRATSR